MRWDYEDYLLDIPDSFSRIRWYRVVLRMMRKGGGVNAIRKKACRHSQNQEELLAAWKGAGQLQGRTETRNLSEQEIPEPESPEQRGHVPQERQLPETLQNNRYGELYLKGRVLRLCRKQSRKIYQSFHQNRSMTEAFGRSSEPCGLRPIAGSAPCRNSRKPAMKPRSAITLRRSKAIPTGNWQGFSRTTGRAPHQLKSAVISNP